MIKILCLPCKVYFSFLKIFYGKILSIALSRALMLYYCLVDSNTSSNVKLTIFLGLGYFFSPLDIIPDLIPCVGLGDDVGILAYTKKAANMWISHRHKEKAYETLKNAFGESFAKKSKLLSI